METFLALRGLEVISTEHCVVAGAENRRGKGNDSSRIVSVICEIRERLSLQADTVPCHGARVGEKRAS